MGINSSKRDTPRRSASHTCRSAQVTFATVGVARTMAPAGVRCLYPKANEERASRKRPPKSAPCAVVEITTAAAMVTSKPRASIRF